MKYRSDMINQANKKRMVIILEFDEYKKWSKSVLGKEFDFTINNREYRICTPLLPNNYYNEQKQLLPPPFVDKLRRGEEEIDYGYVYEYPSGNSIIKAVIIDTIVETEDEAERLTILIQKKIEEKIEHFFCYLNIVNGNLQLRNTISGTGTLSIEYGFFDGQFKHIDPHSEYILSIFETPTNCVLTCDNVEKSLFLLSNNIAIPLEYEYYLTAKKALEYGDFRKCILDSATACEICITSEIYRVLDGQMSSDDIEEYLKGYNSLRKKTSLLGEYGYEIGKLNIEVINDPRDCAIHAGKGIERVTATRAFNQMKKILDIFSKFW